MRRTRKQATSTSSTQDKTPARNRVRARRAVALLAIGGLVVAGTAVAIPRLNPDEAPAVAAAVLEVATATPADLSGTESVSGVVENAATFDVLHRVDGVTPSAAPTASETTAPSVVAAGFASTGDSTSAGAATGTKTGNVAVVPVDPGGTTSTTTLTTTTSTTSTSTTSTTIAPDTTGVEPTTTAAPGTTPTTGPQTTDTTLVTVPSLASPTTTVVEEGAMPSSTAPSGLASGTGSRPSGGGAAPGGGSFDSAVTADATGATDAVVTERITSLPALGEPIDNGDVLYSVDGSPVIALVGELPAWRALSIDSENGADIAQLEAALVALGYGDAVTVDAEFDSATAAAVEAWQQGTGGDVTGAVTLGSIVFVPTGATITAVEASVGNDVASGDVVLSVSAPSQSVGIDIDANQVALFGVGQTVTIETGNADGHPITGVVTTMQSVTSDDGIGIHVTIVPAEPTGVADGSTVDVVVEVSSDVDASSAVVVPSEALVSRLDGTYAVEVRDSGGSSEWVPVDVVQFNGSSVAITGIAAGTDVLVPV